MKECVTNVAPYQWIKWILSVSVHRSHELAQDNKNTITRTTQFSYIGIILNLKNDLFKSAHQSVESNFM